ncbi:MAG TPA: helix-turn-helix transcriptional regulator [Candidatus Limivicinus faecipullorum]|nr:helix-turn-helix transcriptional regulator [Candidatus Limivicinus faecipullorum]
MDYYDIGQRIRTLRREKKLSQEQLAEKVWISTTHMSHIENGSTKLSLPVLVDLGGSAGRERERAVGGAEQPVPQCRL